MLGADAARGEGMASGDVVNTAARLQAAAPVDGILVGETTYRATDRAITYRPADPVVAKGKSKPVPVWEAVEARARLGVDVVQRPTTPLVGRGEEVDLLLRRAAPLPLRARGAAGHPGRRARHRQEPAGLGADAGGRARPRLHHLAAGALAALRRRRHLLGAGRDGEGPGRHPRLRHRPGGRGQAARHRRRPDRRPDRGGVGRGARARAGRPGGAGRRRQATATARPRPPGGGSSRRWPTSTRWCSCSRTCTGPTTRCSTSSTTWSTGPTGVPMLVVCTARPELLDRRGGWGGGKRNALTVALSPLADADIARLIGDAARAGAAARGDPGRRCSSTAAGNPLYAEEYVRMLIDRGHLQHDGGRWRLATGAALPVPESVQGLIAARLDDLPAEQKRLLQDAAVLGKVVWLGALAAMSGINRYQAEDAPACAGAAGDAAPGAALDGGRRHRVRLPPRADARRRLRADPPCPARRQAPPGRRVDRVAVGRPRRRSGHARPPLRAGARVRPRRRAADRRARAAHPARAARRRRPGAGARAR